MKYSQAKKAIQTLRKYRWERTEHSLLTHEPVFKKQWHRGEFKVRTTHYFADLVYTIDSLDEYFAMMDRAAEKKLLEMEAEQWQ